MPFVRISRDGSGMRSPGGARARRAHPGRNSEWGKGGGKGKSIKAPEIGDISDRQEGHYAEGNFTFF